MNWKTTKFQNYLHQQGDLCLTNEPRISAGVVPLSFSVRFFMILFGGLLMGLSTAHAQWTTDGDTVLLNRKSAQISKGTGGSAGDLILHQINGAGTVSQKIRWQENILRPNSNYTFDLEYTGSNSLNSGDIFQMKSSKAGDIMTVDAIGGGVRFHKNVTFEAGTNITGGGVSDVAKRISDGSALFQVGFATDSNQPEILVGSNDNLTIMFNVNGSGAASRTIDNWNGGDDNIVFRRGVTNFGTNKVIVQDLEVTNDLILGDNLDLTGMEFRTNVVEGSTGRHREIVVKDFPVSSSQELRWIMGDEITKMTLTENAGLDIAGPISATNLGTAAQYNVGTSADNLVQLDATGKIPTSLYDAGSSNDSKWIGDTDIHYDGGYVGIGTDNPTSALHIGGGNINVEDDIPAIYLTETTEVAENVTSPTKAFSMLVSNSNFMLVDNGTPEGGGGVFNPRLQIVDNGNVAIGDLTPTEKLEVDGNVKADTILANGSQLTGITASQIADLPGSSSPWLDEGNGNVRYDGNATVGGNIDASDMNLSRSVQGNIATLENTLWNANIELKTPGRSVSLGLQDNYDQGFYIARGGLSEEGASSDFEYLLSVNRDGNVKIGNSNRSLAVEKLDVDGNIKADTILANGSQLTGITASQIADLPDNSSPWLDDGNGSVSYDGNAIIDGNIDASDMNLSRGRQGSIAILQNTRENANIELKTPGKSVSIGLQDDGNQGFYIAKGTMAETGNSSDFEYLMSVNRDGNVKIGNSNSSLAAEKLDVDGNIKADSFIGDGSQLRGINSSEWVKDGDDISYTEGNVGIGVDNPSRELHIRGESAILRVDRDRFGAGLNLVRYDENFTAIKKSWLISGDEDRLSFIDWGENITGGDRNVRMTINNSGSVGIGVDSPQRALHLRSTKGMMRIDRDRYIAGINLVKYDTDFQNIQKSWGVSGDENGFYISDWGTNINQNGQEVRLFVSPTGDVGIGETNPTEKLEVAGNIKANSFIGDGRGITNINIDNIAGLEFVDEKIETRAVAIENRNGSDPIAGRLRIRDNADNGYLFLGGEENTEENTEGVVVNLSGSSMAYVSGTGTFFSTIGGDGSLLEEPHVFRHDVEANGRFIGNGSGLTDLPSVQGLEGTSNAFFTLNTDGESVGASLGFNGTNNNTWTIENMTDDLNISSTGSNGGSGGATYRFAENGDLHIPGDLYVAGQTIAVDLDQHSGDLNVSGNLDVEGYGDFEDKVIIRGFDDLGNSDTNLRIGKTPGLNYWSLNVFQNFGDTYDPTQDHLVLQSISGNVGIGDVVPADEYKLDVAGTIHADASGVDGYSIVASGAVHIGPHDGAHSLSSAASLEDVYLFVEEGIATEDMTYIFKEDWDEWPDYVFDEDYDLSDLDQLEEYIREHKHLPGVISQQEVKENGVSDKQMNITLLEKIEELTLYTIDQDNKLQEQEKLNATLLEGLRALEEKVNQLSNN